MSTPPTVASIVEGIAGSIRRKQEARSAVLAIGDDPQSDPGGGIPGSGIGSGVDVADDVNISREVNEGIVPAEDNESGDLDWDDTYNYPGLGGPVIPDNGVKQVRDDMAAYASPSYVPKARVMDVAGIGHEDSWALSATADPLLIAGNDWARRSVTLIAGPTNNAPIYVGTQSGTFPTNLVGPGRGYSLLYAGQARVIRHQDDIYVKADPTATTAVLSVSIERYERS